MASVLGPVLRPVLQPAVASWAAAPLRGGQPWKPGVNVLDYPVWSGTAGAGMMPEGWGNTGGAGGAQVELLTSQGVRGYPVQPVRLRRINATGFEGLQEDETLLTPDVGYTVEIFVRRPSGVTASGLSFWDGIAATVIATAATMNAQTDDVWVSYSATYQTGAVAPLICGFVLTDGAVGTGVDLAFPVVRLT